LYNPSSTLSKILAVSEEAVGSLENGSSGSVTFCAGVGAAALALYVVLGVLVAMLLLRPKIVDDGEDDGRPALIEDEDGMKNGDIGP